MKPCLILCCILTMVALGTSQEAPKRNYVPNSETAIAIAEAVFIPVFGKKQIESERPFRADLKNDVLDCSWDPILLRWQTSNRQGADMFRRSCSSRDFKNRCADHFDDALQVNSGMAYYPTCASLAAPHPGL
jgi:hypothetical protein